MQAFEKYPRLKTIILHAANNWKTDSRWSELLNEINSLCLKYEGLKFIYEPDGNCDCCVPKCGDVNSDNPMKCLDCKKTILTP